jgi:cellulose synthase/poly-beta-1,6-N-acetylglucosamine synthase-like glycosyltransferase
MAVIFGSFILFLFAGWLLIAAVACVCAFNCQLDPRPVETGYYPATVVIIPVKGVPAHLDALWRSICAQIYHPFRIVFAVESTEDAAYEALQSLANGPPTEIVVAGATTRRGQKVHNLLAALQTLRPTDTAIVFADADIVPASDWLMRLIRPLCDPRNSVVSGYRWLAPTDERWSTAFVCAANASIATLARIPQLNFVWGGSVALRRETLNALDLKACWDRAICDDLILTRVTRSRGYIYGPREILVPTPASYSWREAIAFWRRQYLFVRVHSLQWLLAAGATTLPLIGWAIALPLAATGNGLAIVTLLLVNLLDHLRARLRRRVPLKLWGTEMPSRMAWLDRWGTPAVLAFHAIVIWSTLFGGRVTWAGRTYWIDAQGCVIKISNQSVATAKTRRVV